MKISTIIRYMRLGGLVMRWPALCAMVLVGLLSACSSTGGKVALPVADVAPEQYVIGPGDTLQVFVWQHPEVSVTVPVRPDGRISMPLVTEILAVGKTPPQLSKDLEAALGEFIRSPTVNVIVTNFQGTFGSQVRVVGQAAKPQALPYRQDMTVLDVMITVGGLAETAAGNRARIVRRVDGKVQEIPVRLNDLLNKGKLDSNVPMRPGDVLVIPESLL
jgi:polysaccharide biosynthesis/export protein